MIRAAPAGRYRVHPEGVEEGADVREPLPASSHVRAALGVAALAMAALAAAGCSEDKEWVAHPSGRLVVSNHGSGIGVSVVLRQEDRIAMASLEPTDRQGRPVEVRPEDARPRKVIIGTVCHDMYGPWPGLTERCAELGALVDRIAARAEERYGRGPDLVVLPECALADMRKPTAAERAIGLGSEGFAAFAEKARALRTYIIVPAYVADAGKVTNSAVLFGRDGAIVGRYDKMHVVPDEPPSDLSEDGTTPGEGARVFTCDFGRLGMQICWDIQFAEGWAELGRRGAELVAWPTLSPGVVAPARHAIANGYLVVSSTWRNNASVVAPTGMVLAQIEPPEEMLVHQIDLTYRVVGWHPKLKDGAALKEAFGDAAGFVYSDREDAGVFWSNDPRLPVDAMLRHVGVRTLEAQKRRTLEHIGRLQSER